MIRKAMYLFYSMVGMVAGTMTNIILDPVFIFLFGMELRGAAIATVIGNLVAILIYAYYYLAKKVLIMPSPKMMKLDGSIIREIMWVGIPHTLEQFLLTLAMIVLNNLAAFYGKMAVAAMGVASKIMSFGNYIYQGMAAGCQPLVGYNYGAKNYERMKALFKAGVAVITSMELVVMGFFGIFAPWMIGLFSSNAEVVSIGIETLRAFLLMLPFVGTVSLVRNVFNAIGKPLYALGITIVRQLILYIPFLLLFHQLWGYQGLIHAQPVEEAFCMVAAVWILKKFMEKI